MEARKGKGGMLGSVARVAFRLGLFRGLNEFTKLTLVIRVMPVPDSEFLGSDWSLRSGIEAGELPP